MQADDLKALQTPLKDAYRQDPARARLALRATGELVPGAGPVCRVGSHTGTVEAGLHPAAGGDGSQACAGTILLEALVACAGVTLGAVATASYFIDQLGPLFDLPVWARNLSVFALYGTPLTGAVDWMRVGALLAITILGLAVGIGTFRRRDVMSSG